MERKGTIDLPLHYGHSPRWLFEKMVLLAKAISQVILMEFGEEYFLERLADPFWFQSLGCVLGFDWHSSGLTTTVCGALKVALRDLDCGLFVCGGKGSTSRKTPQEIEAIGYKLGKDSSFLVYASRIVAKVDNNALQDGFTLYHHTFIFNREFKWTVIQQGMSKEYWARRYHWHSQKLSCFIKSPHTGIVSQQRYLTLNMVDKEKDKLRELTWKLSLRRSQDNLKEIISLKNSLLRLPPRHRLLLEDINPRYLEKIFLTTYQKKPQDFESLLSLEGVGPKTMRALALIADLIYGEKVSFKDPARFSFAHGGKDGHPYKINLTQYEKTIDVLEKILNKAKIQHSDRAMALRRLHKFYF